MPNPREGGHPGREEGRTGAGVSPGATPRPLDFRDAWFWLRRNGRLIGTVVAATVLALLIGLAVVPARYSATVVVLVDPRQPRVTPSEAVLGGIGSDAVAVESQVDLLNAPELARRVIEQMNLQEDREFAAKGMLAWLGVIPDEQTQMSRLVRDFQRQLVVRRRGLTYVIEVTFTSKLPAKAAQIANAITTMYVEDQRAAKLDATAKVSDWLNSRIRELGTRVTESERAVASYKAAHDFVDTGQGIGLIARQIETLNQQLTAASAAVAEARARLDQVRAAASRAGDPSTLSEALQSPLIASLRAQYAAVASNEAELSATLGNQHPSLVRLRAQMTDLRRQIDAELKRVLASVRNESDVATSRQKSLDAELAKLKEQAAKNGQTDVRLAELQREAEANRALFDQFLFRSKETTAQESFQIADARIVSAAMIPARSTRPAVPLLLGVAGGLGIVAGIGLALLRERLDRTFRTAPQVESELSLPCLGIVPIAPASDRTKTLFRAVVDQPDSSLAESLHAVRARLRLARRSGLGQVLIVLSAMSGEGRSVVAANLAHAAAMVGLRTILIDLDLLTGSLTTALAPARPGLIEVLGGKAALDDIIVQDEASGLSFVGTGDRRDVLAALRDVDDDRLVAVLTQCRMNHDCVVIDSAAILRSPEMPELIRHVDWAALVVEWRHTERDMVAAALEALGPGADQVAGVVLNKVDLGRYHLYDRSSARFILPPGTSRVSDSAPVTPAAPAPKRLPAAS
jgi:uncharacterized protein involved in exopolysaccharide biosynthesis/Mrp family chromosome partitioning ATPase